MPPKGKKGSGPAAALGRLSSYGLAIKGCRGGLRLILPDKGDFAEVLAALQYRLASAGEFFRGAAIHLAAGGRQLTADELGALQELLRQKDMTLLAEAPQPAKAPLALPDEWALIVRSPLRSGQRLKTEGGILVLGDMHPGAEIQAGRDVVVMGAARGAIAAGLLDGVEAFVFAFQLRPTLLRIGQVTARSPGTGPAWGAEIARVKDGQILVEPFLGWQRRESKRPRQLHKELGT